MPRFFIEKEAVASVDGVKTVCVTGSDAHHITVSLRMRPGETLEVCDMERREYTCRIISADAGKVVAEVLAERESDAEPPYKAVIYQCLPKSGKLESIVMKAVECGAYAVVPVLSERCVSRPDEKSAPKKLARLQKIAAEAAGQCGRAVISEVRGIMPFDAALREASRAELPLFFYEGCDVAGNAVRALRDVLADFGGGRRDFTVSVFIGSEGGFAVRETAAALDYGMNICGLGARILRSETVAPYVLACLSYAFEK